MSLFGHFKNYILYYSIFLDSNITKVRHRLHVCACVILSCWCARAQLQPHLSRSSGQFYGYRDVSPVYKAKSKATYVLVAGYPCALCLCNCVGVFIWPVYWVGYLSSSLGLRYLLVCYIYMYFTLGFRVQIYLCCDRCHEIFGFTAI